MADQINSGQIVSKPEIIISPTSPLPPGIIGVSQDTSKASDSVKEEDTTPTTVDVGTEAVTDDITEGTDTSILTPPSTITVVSQTTRFVNGRAVIDVQIEVEDVPGVTDYEVRYAVANSTGAFTYV